MAWQHHDLGNGYQLSADHDARGGPEIHVSHGHQTVASAQFTPLPEVDAEGEYVQESRPAWREPLWDEDGAQITTHRKVAAWKPWMVEVNPQHRRKGLATAMYRHLESATGVPIKNGHVQSPEGKAFRARYNERFPQTVKSEPDEPVWVEIPAAERGAGGPTHRLAKAGEPVPAWTPGEVTGETAWPGVDLSQNKLTPAVLAIRDLAHHHLERSGTPCPGHEKPVCQAHVKKLVAAIQQGHALPPVVVREEPRWRQIGAKRYVVDDGNHRVAAALKAGHRHVPVVIRSGPLGKSEVAGEDLEKMALVHDDPANPATVWRVEGPEGAGPYTAGTPASVVHAARHQYDQWHFDQRRAGGDDANPQPGGVKEWTPEERGTITPPDVRDSPYRYAFEHPDHAVQWFGQSALDRMKAEGYALKPARAAKVFRSRTGRQVAYLPADPAPATPYRAPEPNALSDKYVTKSEEPLAKVGLTPGSTANRMTPHTTSPYEGVERIESFDAGHEPNMPEWRRARGESPKKLYHHVYHKWTANVGGYHSVLHALSTSPNPMDESHVTSSASAGDLSVADARADTGRSAAKLGRSIPKWRDGRFLQVGEAATQGYYQGQGHGTKLYDAMLRYHGRMASDSTTSGAADAVWEKLAKMPEHTVRLGYGNQHVHTAEYTGPKPVPIRVWDASTHPKTLNRNPWEAPPKPGEKPKLAMKDLIGDDFGKSEPLGKEEPAPAAPMSGDDMRAAIRTIGSLLERLVPPEAPAETPVEPPAEVKLVQAPAPEVALVLAYDASGRLLLGKRNDSGRYTLPGGHLDPGESPEDGARRELKEETGLEAHGLARVQHLKPNAPGGPVLAVYTALVAGTPHGGLDPDREVSEWFFFDVAGGLDPIVRSALHGPDDHTNVVRQLHPAAVGLTKAEPSPLIKVQPTITFPSLGMGDDRRETPIVDTDHALKTQQRAILAHGARAMEAAGRTGDAATTRAQGPHIKWSAGTVSVTPGAKTGFVMSTPLRRKHLESMQSDDSAAPMMHANNSSVIATKAHEDFHQMMNRVRDAHGAPAARHMLSSLWDSVPAQARAHAQRFIDWRMGMSPDHPHYPEERIALLHNYLNNPGERRAYAEYGGLSDAHLRIADQGIKQTMRHLRQRAAYVSKDTMEEHASAAQAEQRMGKSEDDLPCQTQVLLRTEGDAEDAPLLTHHDPRERAFAVLAHRLTPRQLHRAARDPHPDVRAAALGHPDLTPAMLHLLCHSRHLADGRPVGKAVVDFLTHPHATKEHAKAVLGAAKNDPSPEAREAEAIANEVGARWGS